ncbi:hypothetical protein HDU91_005236 [Kappamyces sp. JEL0680]|nr:hypothetical protein HDU91_005236 [Kappamyces sp. JEL0680]
MPLNRYRADTLANNTPAVRVENGGKKDVPAMALQPGDIVYVAKGGKFYVDVVLLSSSYEDGTAFIETAELDGETNLKRKSAVNKTAHCRDDASTSEFHGTVQCEHPNERLLNFEGRLALAKAPEDYSPLSLLHFVPRGSVLRNTDYVYGVVIYSGLNTKIMKNLKQGKLKSSSLEAKLNNLVAYAFVFNAVLLVSAVVLEYVYYVGVKQNENYLTDQYPVNWYIGFQTPSVGYHIWAATISFFTIFTYVIPISLFVTIELVRLGQATYMTWDPKMKYRLENDDESVSMIPMRVNNSNLNEDLGCVDYIFSDKTGTFTQNSMVMSNYFVEGYVMDEMKEPGVVLKHIKDESIPFKVRHKMDMFLRALSVCHGVIPSWDEHKKEFIYESQSPDETALLIAARTNSYSLVNRNKQGIDVEIQGVKETFELLTTIEFNSTRKRMSTVVRTSDGIRLYCKGADNIMMARLDNSKHSPDMLKKANDALTEFSNIGLRTLVVGYRDLSESEYAKFKKAYDEAEVSLDMREALMDQASESVEKGLTLLGCTAIEDKLQNQLPETIENLLLADIKLWLLTGDKQETAVNIGLSSRLINKSMKLLLLSASSPDAAETSMDQMIAEQQAAPPSQVFALVVDGHVLSHVFAGAEKSKAKFLTIGTRCKTVICARVTPLQKALVVRLVRNALKSSITLAIGDGANDVSMIQEAHVGVGIMGKEGTQAVRAADYAFGEFRFLQRLLTVHGRFNYLRMTGLILYSFYKNFVFIIIQWYFGFVNAWSGQTVYESLFFISYNVIFVSIPPLVYGLYERDLPEQLLEKFPQLYKQVKDGLYWNFALIVRWFVLSMLQSLFIFGVAYYLNYQGTLDFQGRSTGYWVQCYLFSTPLLLVVLAKQATISRFWIWITSFGILISLALNVALMFGLVILTYFTFIDYETAVILHSLPAYYLLIVLLPAICTLPDLLIS